MKTKTLRNNKLSLRRLTALIMCLMLLVVSLFSAAASEDITGSTDIVILYENDVHCAIDGYSMLSAMKKELTATHNYVGVVSVGDFVQGDTLGAISRGEYIVNIMNLVGYDAIALGNHEFDFKLPRLLELSDMLDTKPVCSNFYRTTDNTAPFKPYVIKSYGDTDIAFVGVTTPDTLTSSSPAQFMDSNGNYIYSFSGTSLYSTVQSAIDSAEAEGADYIIGLSHLGTEDVFEQWSAQTLIQNTSGFDAVLDGHSHSVVESMTVKDKDGNPVQVTSTGTKFANIGKLTVSDSGITTELIPTESCTATDPEVDSYIASVREEYSVLGNRVVAKSEVELIIADENGNRIIRNTETNLGDLCADAFRIVTGADIGVINGGGIRNSISSGEVTFNDLLSVYPFNNTVCVAEVKGQQILDFLELSVCTYPEENGSFQHVSGLTYTLNSYIPSTVVFDENMAFSNISGERRVSDVKILNSDSDKYEPVDAEKTYTLASHNYLLLDHGSGATMLDGSSIISNSGMLDVELLEVYINEHLGGVIGEEYSTSQQRVSVVTEKQETPTSPSSPDTNTDSSDKSPLTGYTDAYIVAFLAVSLLFVVLALNIRRQKTK